MRFFVAFIVLILLVGCGPDEETRRRAFIKETEERQKTKQMVEKEKKRAGMVMLAEKAEKVEAIERGEFGIEVTTNPFLTVDEEEFYEDPDYRDPVILGISAIFYMPPDSKIIVSGKVYKEGDIIDNKRIIKIKPEEAILKDTRGEYSLELEGVLPQPCGKVSQAYNES